MKKTAVLSIALLGTALAQEKDVKFTLDFSFQGPQAPFVLAAEKGYYAAEGLNVKIDRGFGSADAINKVASGAYDMGFGDINSMIEFNTKNPKSALIAVFVLYDAAPFTIFTLKSSDIKTPKDLEGKTLAAPVGDAGRRLFEVFADKAGFDASKVKWINVDAALRETTLVRNQADGISGFYFTSMLNLKAAGAKADDIATFPYSKYIKGLYGNAVVVRPEFAKQNPQVVKGFLRAFTKGIKDSLDNPNEAIAALKKRDPLINEALEMERFKLAMSNNVLTPNARAFGVGQVRYDRLQENIKVISSAFELPAVLKARNVFREEYLPPLAERKFK